MKSTVRKLIRDYFKKYTIHGLFISVLILLSQMTALIEPFLLKTVFDEIIPEKNISLLVILAVSLILLRIIGALIQYLQKRLSTKIGSNIFSSFVVDFYDHVQRLDLAFFADTKMGEFYQRLGQDVYHIYRMIFNGIVVSFSNILFIMALFIYGLYLSPFLSLIMILVIPLFIFFQSIAGKMTRKATERMVKDWSDVGSFQNEKLNSIRLIKELCIEDEMRWEYDRLNRISGKSLRDLEIATSVGIIFTDFTIFLGPILVLLVGIYMHLSGSLSLGTVIAFFYFSSRLFTPIGQIVNQQLAYQRAKVGIDRIYEYFDRQPKILENEETR
jgi:ABC-type bacteriocin/lantibiotic exporter with double-glycine peptidase domain